MPPLEKSVWLREIGARSAPEIFSVLLIFDKHRFKPKKLGVKSFSTRFFKDLLVRHCLLYKRQRARGAIFAKSKLL